MSIPLLVTIELTQEHRSRLESAGFDIHYAPTSPERTSAIQSSGNRIRAVLTNGSTGLNASVISALPNLEIICAQGAGYENIDLSAARAQGIVITHGPGTNDTSVADHAMALLMASARGIVQADLAVKRGEWASSRQLRPMISGKKLGILGLGNIGEQIARRGSGGFGMSVAYHNRKPRAQSPWHYFPSPHALAEWSDFLVVATPGGALTTHLVNEAVLHALGPDGFLINISRGSVVDTVALIDALKKGYICAAALDVVEGEPHVPAELMTLQNVILTPHIAGRAPEAAEATFRLVLDNLQAFFAGRQVLTPVP